ncbi:hypothetical protein TrCOL_g81 [Triparma columacea]|uniref:Uncharacterized protein n=1 Tax=Triparma columacea TaxID=722753 RepID=A0A9W7GB65_9STRA|nr:hypothetical protein TrCOL_g81 [Triparma columacea]
MFRGKAKCDLDEEAIEEIKMNTHFKRHEIIAYRKAFLYHTTRNLSPPQDGGEGKEGGEDKKGDDDSLDESGKGDGDNSDDKKSESSSSTTPSDSDDTTTTPPTDATSQAEAATTTATKKSQVAPLASTLSFKSSNIPDLSEYPMSITRHQFLNIKSIAMNPLKERIALCFEFGEDPDSTISFEQYMQMAATFNRPGNREVKLKLAFKIQAFTDPKKITKGDLKKYYELVARNGNIDTPVPKKDRKVVINKIMTECSSDSKRQFLSFEDFQRVIGTTDFDTNLKLELNVLGKNKH